MTELGVRVETVTSWGRRGSTPQRKPQALPTAAFPLRLGDRAEGHQAMRSPARSAAVRMCPTQDYGAYKTATD